jgi:N4-(beta-N-acetylglucosaminyl)-L-asparaginase
VDNDIGAAVATGQGEDIVRVAGASSIVEAMRRGLSPEKACRSVVEKLARVRRDQLKDVQVCFLALNKQGEYGGFALRSGFSFAVRTAKLKTLTASRFLW